MTEVRSSGARRRGSGSGSESKAKRVKRHRACQSEFDYDGWKAWGEWRRGVLHSANAAAANAFTMRESMQNMPALASAASSSPSSRRLAVQLDGGDNIIGDIAIDVRNNNDGKKNCSGNCDYPSECRWKRQMTVRTPESVSPGFFSDTATATATAPAPGKNVDNNRKGTNRKVSGTEILLPTVFEEEDNTDTVSKDDFWNSLLASVSRRKSFVQDDSVDLSDLVAETTDDGTKSASV